MAFLPFENFVLHSPLSAEESCKRLTDIVGPVPFFRGKALNKYQGKIAQNTFDITRSINYRNSFVPMIRGTIAPGEYGRGSIIRISMKIDAAVSVFLLIWCGGVAFAGLALVSTLISGSQKFSPAFLIPIGMLAGGYIMATLAFGTERDKAIKDFTELFEAGPVKKGN